MTHATKALQGTDFSEDFHVFGLQWSSDKLVTYLDDPSNTVLEVPFNQSFFERGGWSSNPALNNPWQAANNTNAAPFDQVCPATHARSPRLPHHPHPTPTPPHARTFISSSTWPAAAPRGIGQMDRAASPGPTPRPPP